MASTGSRLDVDCFRIVGPPAGDYGDTLRCKGRVHTKVRIGSVELRVGGVRPHRFPIEPVGEPGLGYRFDLLAKAPLEAIDLKAARLVVNFEGSSSIDIALELPSGHEAIESRRRADSALVMGFESCGDNCEFGLLQRTVGNERIGLLRYAGVDSVTLLAAAIERRFDAFDDPAALQAGVGETGWVVRAPMLDMSFHTGRSPNEIDEHAVVAFASTQLRFVADKFIEDLEQASKIFVFRTRLRPSNDTDMTRLHDVMRRFGPVRLLWVTDTDGLHEAGSVLRVGDGLYRGFLERLLAAGDDYYASTARWLELARNASAAIDGVRG